VKEDYLGKPIHRKEHTITMHVKWNCMRDSVGFIWLRNGTSDGPVWTQ